ncbi:MAG: orotidine-5'-phosphate decarboxylase [Ruminococcaceae bacterium]|nr:orotidine-5'-phosphate decarboxylase [Oscillospiraceae bacterium]
MNVVDKLIERTIKTKNPTVVGLDPDIGKIPACYKDCENGNTLLAAAEVIFEFNRDIIDIVCEFVPAVKLQMAFYEKYGSYGVAAFEKTVAYAKSKDLVVIEDAKRNDIGNTAKAYADGHLGKVETPGGLCVSSFDVDFLTVTPFLGSESLDPFADVCRENDKGIFVLVKTSNTSSGEIQDVITKDGLTISQSIAEYVAMKADGFSGKYGYSSIGAVVGATYPEEAVKLRKTMPKSYFLVPGYGAQGGGAKDVLPCFNPDGLGAVINSSRGILYSHMSDEERNSCSKEEYLNRVRNAIAKMQRDIYTVLKSSYPEMVY